MRTIETIVTVDEQGMATLRMPPDVTPGDHKVVVVIDEATKRRAPLVFSSHDVGPWPLGPGESLRAGGPLWRRRPLNQSSLTPTYWCIEHGAWFSVSTPLSRRSMPT